MSLQSFQQALSELVRSVELRAAAREDPGRAFAAFDLTPREHRRLTAIAADARLATGTVIHRSFRLSMLANALPRTCKILGPQLKRVVHEYWKRNLPVNYYYQQEALRFGRFALTEIERGGLEIPHLREVLELELAALELPAGPETGELGSAPSAQVVIRFHCDPEALLEALDEGRPTGELPPEELDLRLWRDPSGRVVWERLAVEEPGEAPCASSDFQGAG
jgi:hypothetical protein